MARTKSWPLASLSALIVVLGVGLALLYRSDMASFAMSDSAAMHHFAGVASEYKPRMVSVDVEPGLMHFADLAVEDNEHTVVFIHGSPGSWTAFIEYFKNSELLQKTRLISVDRPGFGASDRGEVVVSLQEQARRIARALRSQNIRHGVVLVGHSLGGPVALRLAADYPALVSGVVLIAAAVAPAEERLRWYNRAASWWPVSALLPIDWRSSNREILPLKSELIKLASLLDGIRAPTVVIQGLNDELVSPANADYLEQHLTGVTELHIQRISGLNHFVPWTRPELVVDGILEVLSANPR